MNTLTAMKQALEALEQCYVIPNSKMPPRNRDKAIANLRTAITEMEKAEPVAWYNPDYESVYEHQTKEYCEPLYRCIQSRDSIIEECAVLMETGVFECSQKVLATAIRALKGKK